MSPGAEKTRVRQTGDMDTLHTEDGAIVQPERRALQYRTWVISVAACAAVLVGILGSTLYSKSRTPRAVPRARVSLAQVIRGPFTHDTTAAGRIVAAVSPTLFSPALGVVTFNVAPGSSVSKDQVLAMVDSPSLRNQYDQERATLEKLTQELGLAHVEMHRQSLQSEEDSGLAATRLHAAERELKRAEAAWELRVIPEQDLERARDDRASAEFIFKHAQANAKVQASILDYEIKAKQSDLARQKLLVSDLLRRVNALTIRSPATGFIAGLAVAQKATVAENAPLITVVDLSALQVEFNVPETFASVEVNAPAMITYGGRDYRGTVTSTSPQVVHRTIEGHIRFVDPPPAGLRQGQHVVARIALESLENVVKVERGALRDSDAAAYRVEGDTARRSRVEFGATHGNEIEVLSGLKPGDWVVVSNTTGFNNAPMVRLSD
jgi:HlyD family secretion protein